MLITCLRHATAEPHGLPCEDANRALVGKGRDQALRVADFCRRNGLMPGALYASPLKRAQQTAGLLHGALADCPSVITVDWLSIGSSPSMIIDELFTLNAAGLGDIWLVGHEPDLSELMGCLLNAPEDSLIVKKASLTRLQLTVPQPGAGQLLWSVPCALMH